MNASPRFVFLLLALAGTATWAPAQTATWIGTGKLDTTADWNDPANWSTGAVPAGAGATAVINQAGSAYRSNPDGPYVSWDVTVPPFAGGAQPVLTGATTLGALRFDQSATTSYLAAIQVGELAGSGTGSLRLEDEGLRVIGSNYGRNDVNVSPGSSLILANRAVAGTTGTSSLAIFLGRSGGSSANPAVLQVQDDASFNAGTGTTVTVMGQGPASLVFMDRARAGNAAFYVGNDSKVGFYNTASAGSAYFALNNNTLVYFDQDASAGSARFYFNSVWPLRNSSIIRFAGASSAGQSQITTGNNFFGAVEFTDQATGGTATVSALRLDVSGAVTAGGATGRQRSLSSTPAATSVVATDARTISLGSVAVQDLLLGSNTLEVGAGYLGNIVDRGGAYLSAAGENLVGGSLVKVGPGTLALYGPNYDPNAGWTPVYNNYTGTTTIRAGTLLLYNRASNVTIEAAGTLQAQGGFVDGRLENRGLLSPGSFAPMRVTGDFVQTGTGTFSPYVAAYVPGNPTTVGLQVTGTATLAGRAATGIHPNAFVNWAPGVLTLRVLSASAVTGRFDRLDLAGNPARIKVDVLYAPTSVDFRYEMLPFAQLGTTPAATAFGAYVDRVSTHTSQFFPNNYNRISDELTFTTDANVLARLLTDLGPDRYGVLPAGGFATAQARAGTLQRVLRPDADRAKARGTVFAEGGRRRLDFPAANGLPAANATTSGWLAGGAWRTGDWSFGGYVAREKSTFTLDAAGGHASVRSNEPGAFARYDHAGYFVQATASSSRDRYDLLRLVDHGPASPLNVRHTGNPDGRRTDWSVTAGRTWSGRAWSLTPYAGYLSSRWRMDDFTETTDQPIWRDALAFTGWSNQSRRVQAGVVATTRVQDRVQPRLEVSWWHELDPDRPIAAQLAGAPSGYAAPGRPADQNTLQVVLGLDVRLNRHASLAFNAARHDGSFTRTSSDLTAGFRWEF